MTRDSVQSHTESAGDCPKCKSEDYWLTIERHVVIGQLVTGIWYHCNSCGFNDTKITVADYAPVPV